MKFEGGFVIKCLCQSVADLHRVGLLTEVQVGQVTRKLRGGRSVVFEVLLGFGVFLMNVIINLCYQASSMK